jgi:uncharacterized iron-regulated membrane protein
MPGTIVNDPLGAAPASNSIWERWLFRPEKLRLQRWLFQLHLWLGMLAGLYVFVMSLSGSMIVFRNELEGSGVRPSKLFPYVERLVDFHDNLLLGTAGRTLNGVGALCLTMLCLTGIILWWPGVQRWRRSLTVNVKATFPRLNWDLHNALGFWFFLFVSLWGISGIYFGFPGIFNALVDFLEPTAAANSVQFGQMIILWLTNLHFGRFGWPMESLWVVLGFVPAILSFTGAFMCCHRIFARKGVSLRK